MTTDTTTASPAEPLRGLLDGALHLRGDAGVFAANHEVPLPGEGA
jgi:hypothetical protein